MNMAVGTIKNVLEMWIRIFCSRKLRCHGI